METASLIKSARQTAGLTQLEMAHRAGTAQPAVAAYESGVRTPTFATLERLLDACEHNLELSASPRTRRGAAPRGSSDSPRKSPRIWRESATRYACCLASQTTSEGHRYPGRSLANT
jgi:transcriptional regulator with XRE-family HTH domain